MKRRTSTAIDPSARWQVVHGDALAVLKKLPDHSADSVVTDPPSGMKFMGKEWDADKGGRQKWVSWLAKIFVELRRVVKPGGYAAVWAIPKKSHWTATAIEDAGWDIIDVSTHLFGQGFPKSVDVARVISMHFCTTSGRHFMRVVPPEGKRKEGDHVCPDHPAAEPFTGQGTALKPAAEFWILAQAPMSERTIAKNALKHGTGGLRIGDCRVGKRPESEAEIFANKARVRTSHASFGANRGASPEEIAAQIVAFVKRSGRFPANVTLQHTEDCLLVGTKKVPTGTAHRSNGGGLNFGSDTEKPALQDMSYADEDGMEEVEAWECPDYCAVRILDEQSGERPTHRTDPTKPLHRKGLGYGSSALGGAAPLLCDEGTASRFFYTAKPSTAEKEKGLEHLPKKRAGELTGGRKEGSAGLKSPRAGAGRTSEGRANAHPTVKPVELMRWLCRLVTPAGGLLVDPFAGSGTTVIAALLEHLRVVAIEQDAEFVELAKARALGDAPLLNRLGAAQ